MPPVARHIAAVTAAAVLATATKSRAEQVLQPAAEKLLSPEPAQKTEIGADPAGHPENMPPAELADRVAQAAGAGELSDEARAKSADYLHWVMGVGSGVAYGLAAAGLPWLRAGHGAAFGVGLFAATHGSALPAAGLQHSPAQQPRAWWLWEGGSHVVYGVALDAALRVLDR